jgi:hypothetical protein
MRESMFKSKKIKEVIKVSPDEKLIFLFENIPTQKEVDKFKTLMRKFLTNKKERVILIGKEFSH